LLFAIGATRACGFCDPSRAAAATASAILRRDASQDSPHATREPPQALGQFAVQADRAASPAADRSLSLLPRHLVAAGAGHPDRGLYRSEPDFRAGLPGLRRLY